MMAIQDNNATAMEKEMDQKQIECINDGQVQLVLFDFDQTITCSHLYRELKGGQSVSEKELSDEQLIAIFGGNQRIQCLTKHFK